MKRTSKDYYIVMKIMERHNVSRTQATKLYLNTFLYKTVIDEILRQVDYLVANNIKLI